MYAFHPWNSFGLSVLFSLSQQRVNLGIEEALKKSTKSIDEEQLKNTLKGTYPSQVVVILSIEKNCIGYWSRLLNLSGIFALIVPGKSEPSHYNDE